MRIGEKFSQLLHNQISVVELPGHKNIPRKSGSLIGRRGSRQFSNVRNADKELVEVIATRGKWRVVNPTEFNED